MPIFVPVRSTAVHDRQARHDSSLIWHAERGSDAASWMECPHMKCRLCRQPAISCRDRASPPCRAASSHAVQTVHRVKKVVAGRDVETGTGTQCIDRTGGKAGAFGTGIARAVAGSGKFKLPVKADRSAVADHQPATVMHQHTHRRLPCPARPERPFDERKEGRAAERKECLASHFCSKFLNHSNRPAVKRMWRMITIFGAGGEHGPEPRLRWTEQKQRSAVLWSAVTRLGNQATHDVQVPL